MVVGGASSSPVRDATSADAFIPCCRLRGSFLSVASRRCIAHWGGGGAAADHKMGRLYFKISTVFLHRPNLMRSLTNIPMFVKHGTGTNAT